MAWSGLLAPEVVVLSLPAKLDWYTRTPDKAMLQENKRFKFNYKRDKENNNY